MVLQWLLASSIILASSFVAAQFPPAPEGVTTKQIASHPGLSISYKETHICETTARGWAGYVHMPISYLEDIETPEPYNLSMFFWYFEARNNPQNAPTAIYLAGGPGESSTFAAAQDGVGPCWTNDDSNSTSNNLWSWNDNANMLFIDQPSGVGYSYDALIKSTVDLTFSGASETQTGILPFEAWGDKLPAQNTTFLYGILPSQDPSKTANTSEIAAITLWHFSQAWFGEFPEWRTCDKSVSIWGNSYGGYWVPATGAYFDKQNAKIEGGEINGTVIALDTIGITNGCVDVLYQAEYYAAMACNNTYGLQIINKTIYEESLALYNSEGGCKDLTIKCRALGDQYDPNDLGISNITNVVCLNASVACLDQIGLVSSPYIQGPPRGPMDMAHILPDGNPPTYAQAYFNTEWVQKALGVPVNFTADSVLNQNAILISTGDSIRRAGMKDIEYLLDNGVKVVLVYGDRDQRCPWLGAENLALQANWTGAEAFRAAGYEYVTTNSSYNGGVVRQHGNLSFTRVFEAGHDVAAYQPETVLQVFNRATFNKDVATGKVPASNNYSSTGPASSFGIKNILPPSPPPNCYTWSFGTSCTVDQGLAVLNGTAEIIDYRVVKPAGGGGPIGGGPNL